MTKISDSEVRTVAERIVAARRRQLPIAEFPGPLPTDPATAYAIQDAVIAQYGAPVAGWKVAMIPPPFRERFPGPRLSGPVMEGTVGRPADGEAVKVSIVAGGFAAVEAEFIVRIGRDLPPRARPYEPEEVAAAIADLHAGIEIAGFPLATINDLGPGAVIPCFGNNASILVGAVVPDWQRPPAERLVTHTAIDGVEVGRGSLASLNGGPVGSTHFLVNHLSDRGITLRAGEWVSTGMTTGVHPVVPSQRAVVTFEGVFTFDIRFSAAN